MKDILKKYLPERSVDIIFSLIKQENIHLKIVRERVTRHGDYRRMTNGQHLITINAGANPYRFLITLVHEIAHLHAFKKYGKNIKPHGTEWKYTFQHLMLPFINPEIFPKDLLPVLARHFKNPKASSDTDAYLSIALKSYDPVNNKNYIFEIPEGSTFRISNGKVFIKGKKRIKRYECIEISTRKIYIFQPNAEVELIRTH